MGRGISFFPLKSFCLTVPQNFVGTISVSKNFGSRKILRIRRGYHYFTLNVFCLTGLRNQSFERILVSKIFMHRSNKDLSKLFCFTWPKNFIMRPFCVSEIFSYGKKFMDNRWGVSGCSVEIVLSYSNETFPRGTLLCFGKFTVSKNFMDKRGISQFSVEDLFLHTTEKLRKGTHMCFRNFLLSKKFIDKRGEGGSIKIFCRKFFVLQCRKSS